MVTRAVKDEQVGDAPIGLVRKLTEIILDIGAQEKGARNKDQRYDYYSAEQTYGWWRERLANKHIIVFPRLVETTRPPVAYAGKYRSGGDHFVTEVAYEFVFIDGDSGESIVMGPVLGQGDDSSDKGPGKGLTYSFKSLLLTMGMMAAALDDVEDERYEDRSEAPVTRATRPTIEDSNVEMAGRGGRGAQVNDAQIKRVRKLVTDKGLSGGDLVGLALEIFGDQVEFSDGAAFREYLTSKDSDSVGRLINAMSEYEDIVQAEEGESGEE